MDRTCLRRSAGARAASVIAPLLAALVFFPVCTAGQAHATEALRASRIELLDAGGRTRAVFAASDAGAVLVLLDAQGHRVARYAFGFDGSLRVASQPPEAAGASGQQQQEIGGRAVVSQPERDLVVGPARPQPAQAPATSGDKEQPFDWLDD